MADSSAVGQTERIGKETISIFLEIRKHKETIVLDIVDIKYDIILSIPWLEHHDPMINWKARTLAFDHCECDGHTNGDVSFTKAIWIKSDDRTLASTTLITCSLEYTEFAKLFENEKGSKALS